jgi:hypothetical protein
MKKAASPKNDEAAKICPLGTIQFCTGITSVLIHTHLSYLIQINLSSPLLSTHTKSECYLQKRGGEFTAVFHEHG